MDFKTAFHQQRDAIHAHVEMFFAQERIYTQTVDTHLVHSLDILRDFSLRGGKAISPFLLMLAYKIGGGEDLDSLLPVCGAVELHHKYLLALDDIADRDEKRYGGPTLEYVYRDEVKDKPDSEHRARSLAMLDAAYLNGLSKKLLFQSAFHPKDLISCHQIMMDAMLAETLAGWKIHYYQNVEPLNNVTTKDFIKGLELVTARYKFDGPFRIGLILAGDTNQLHTTALKKYAQCIGTAFQIHDDILGLFGDTEKTGKPVGNDIREGKKTLLVQIAYERAGRDDKEFLNSFIGNNKIVNKDLERVQDIVTSSGSLIYSQELEKQMATEGIRALNALPDSSEKELLRQLARYIVTRDK